MTPARIVMLVLVASAVPASANVGRRSFGGERAGEPVGITDIAIAREELVIDLRPLADRDTTANVTATYHLDNRSDAKHLDLVFATGSETSAFRVTLDGKPVANQLEPTMELPESWRPPATTPGFDGRELGYELVDRATPVGFGLDVPPGRHDLAITYSAGTSLDHAGDPTLLYQFGYVLSPARTWAGFGGLDVTVHVPAGWRIAVTPALKREGDTLHGTFTTVPADALALTLQAPPGAHAVVTIASRVLFAIVAFSGGFVIAVWTRSRERRRRDAAELGSGWNSFGRGFAWGAAFFATGLLAVFGPDLALPAGQADHYGYGQAFAVIGLVLGAPVVIAIGTIVSSVVTRRVYRADPAG